jgi:hypothetical protein
VALGSQKTEDEVNRKGNNASKGRNCHLASHLSPDFELPLGPIAILPIQAPD